jgi:DNA-binding response OmpR family regulator
MARILLVDDDSEQLRVRRLLLERKGHEVRTASTVVDALGAVAETGPEVVVMDLRLPRLEDGQSLIRSLRAHSAAVRIIVLSGLRSGLSGLPEAVLVDTVLAKPFPAGNLLAEVERLAKRV